MQNAAWKNVGRGLRSFIVKYHKHGRPFAFANQIFSGHILGSDKRFEIEMGFVHPASHSEITKADMLCNIYKNKSLLPGWATEDGARSHALLQTAIYRF